MKSHSIRVGGHRIAYRLAGDGPVLLLVHGIAGTSLTWRHVMPSLARQFTVLAPDLLGQGESENPDIDYSLATHADSLRDLMDGLGFERATLVGQSLGGGMAMQFTYQFPQRCERLVLVDSGGFGPEVTFYLRMLSIAGIESAFPWVCAPWMGHAGDRIVSWLGRAGMRSMPAGKEIWRSYASLTDAERRRAFFRSLRDVVDFNGQAVTAIGRLSQAARLPTLIVWGAKDPFIPVSHAYVAHEAIPGSRLEIFDEVGHYPHCEAPERFLAVLLDFLATTNAARLRADG